ncbi:unnamed protein product [Amoebophrya sp. A25]|nr:unnamed protein product [Amoebophrya sp. A25]|eukprot:GSA25T00007766001.1
MRELLPIPPRTSIATYLQGENHLPDLVLTNALSKCLDKGGAPCTFVDPFSRRQRVATSSREAGDEWVSRVTAEVNEFDILNAYLESTDQTAAREHIRAASKTAGDLYLRSFTIGTEILQLVFSILFYAFALIISTLGMRTVRDRSSDTAKPLLQQRLRLEGDPQKGEVDNINNKLTNTASKVNGQRVLTSSSLLESVKARVSNMLSGRGRSCSDSADTSRLDDNEDFPEAADFSESDVAPEDIAERQGLLQDKNTSSSKDKNAKGNASSMLRSDTLETFAQPVDSQYALRKAGLLRGNSTHDVDHAGPFLRNDNIVEQINPLDGEFQQEADGNIPSRRVSQARSLASGRSAFSTTSSLRRLDADLAADAGVIREIARVRRMENPEEQVLFLRNVKKAYPGLDRPAVAHVHFAVSPDSASKLPQHLQRHPTLANGSGIFGLLGRNGAGKTTLFKLILRLEAVSEGEVYILGEKSLVPYHRIGYCPQFDESLLMSLTVFENLRFYGQLKLRELYANWKIQALIDELKLGDFQDKKCGHLSAGVQRKVCFAISLLGSPDILLLDEPGVGIDLVSKTSMWELVSKHIRMHDNKVCIFTTNSMEEGNDVCHQIAIQVQGHWKCLGGLREFQEKYGGGYQVVCDFIGKGFNSCDQLEEDAVRDFDDVLNGTGGLPTGNDEAASGAQRETFGFLFGGSTSAEDEFTRLGGASATMSTSSTTPAQQGTTMFAKRNQHADVVASAYGGPSGSGTIDNSLNKDSSTTNLTRTATQKSKKSAQQRKKRSKLTALRKRQSSLLEDLEEQLQFEYEVMQTRGTQVVLRFPTVTENSPLSDVQRLLEFFQRRPDLRISFGQMQLKHIFHKFAGEVAI